MKRVIVRRAGPSFPEGLNEIGAPRTVPIILAEDFSRLIRGPRRLRLARQSALSQRPNLYN